MPRGPVVRVSRHDLLAAGPVLFGPEHGMGRARGMESLAPCQGGRPPFRSLRAGFRIGLEGGLGAGRESDEEGGEAA